MRKKIHPHLNSRFLTFENLILAIEALENDGIISFEDFCKLEPYIIREQFFSGAHPTLVIKAKAKIYDIRNGNFGPSSITQTTIIYETDKEPKVITKKPYF